MLLIILNLILPIYTMLRTDRILGGGMIYYIAASGVIIVTEVIVLLSKRKFEFDGLCRTLLETLLLFDTIRLFLQYEIACMKANTLIIAKHIFFSLVLTIGTYIVVTLVFYYTSESILKFISIFGFILLPILLLTCTLQDPTNGSHIELRVLCFKVVSLSFATVLLPFVISFIMNTDYFMQFSKRFPEIRIQHFISLIYCMVNATILVINKDLGTFLIFMLVYVIIIFPTLNHICQAGIIGTLSLGIAFLYKCSTTFRVRLNDVLSTASTSDANYFRYLYQHSGVWGDGYQRVSLGRIDALAEDYILCHTAACHGALYLISIILLSLTLVKTLTTMCNTLHHNCFLEILAQSAILTYMIPTLYVTGMSFGVLPVTGIPFPFLGAGTSCHIAYTFIMALVTGLYLRTKR